MEALASYRASLRILERLAAYEPENAVTQRDLSLTHVCIGARLAAQNNSGAAHASFRAALAIDKQLVDDDPHDMEARAYLAFSHARLARFMAEFGRQDEALDLYRKGRDTVAPNNGHGRNAELENYLSAFGADIAHLEKVRRRRWPWRWFS